MNKAPCKACQYSRWVLTVVILVMMLTMLLSERGFLNTF